LGKGAFWTDLGLGAHGHKIAKGASDEVVGAGQRKV